MSCVENGSYPKINQGLRSGQTGNEDAWTLAQEMFLQRIVGYEELVHDHGGILKDVFSGRRRAFFATTEEDREAINREVSKKLQALDDLTLDMLEPSLVVIRDLFDVQSPTNKGPRNWMRNKSLGINSFE